jgi:hypothetical protein
MGKRKEADKWIQIDKERRGYKYFILQSQMIMHRYI